MKTILGDEVSLAKKAPDLCCQMECKGEALGKRMRPFFMLSSPST